ncbi:hypothetical protein C6500_01350 [Candidatus Poribacteria bacterium]|nr:MAG: hypothetical protein C6500_01350 [Candidatus Poribacteria bacterium]
MSAMEKSIIFLLFIGLIFCIYGCGKNFDDSAAELDLAFDSPVAKFKMKQQGQLSVATLRKNPFFQLYRHSELQ